MPDQELMTNLIKAFHLTLNYLKIYPPSSQMVTASLDTFYKTLSTALEKEPTVTLSDMGGRPLINGKELESRDIQLIGGNLVRLLATMKIQSISFSAGIAQAELLGLANAILKRAKESLNGYPHIALDQTVYVAMVKGEETIVKITEMVGRSGNDIAAIMTMLRESYDLMEPLPEASRQQAQERLAQELAKQDAAVLREIFERELPQKIESSGLKSRLLNALSQEKIQGIFGDIAAWYEAIRAKESSDFAAIEQLGKLGKFIQTVLLAPAAKDIPRQFFEELLRKGLIEQLPNWFLKEPSQPATVLQVERFLEKPPAELAEKENRELIPGFAEKLCQLGDDSLLGKLTEKLVENLANQAATIRLPAAETALLLHDVLQAHAKENILRIMELPVLEAARREVSVEIHGFLIEILRQRARRNLLHGEYDLAIRIIELFRRHTMPDSGLDPKILQHTAASLQRLISEAMELVIADFKSDNERKRLGSLQVIGTLGERAVDPLLQIIKESLDIRSRRLAALALKDLGEKARHRFADELNLGLIPGELKHIVEALPELGGADMLEQISSLLRYPDAGVKIDLLKFLARLNNPQAQFLIIEQLKDRDCGVVSEAARLLGELRSKEAVEGLLAALRGSQCPAPLAEEICIALGQIADPRAIPALIDKMKKKKALFRKSSPEEERIRLRAAWALRKFSGPAVEQALESAARTPTDPVALTAKESLSILKKTAFPK